MFCHCMLLSSAALFLAASAVVIVVVDLPQEPEDDPRKRWRCAWMVDELTIVGACVMAMVGWVEAGMDVVGGEHAG